MRAVSAQGLLLRTYLPCSSPSHYLNKCISHSNRICCCFIFLTSTLLLSSSKLVLDASYHEKQITAFPYALSVKSRQSYKTLVSGAFGSMVFSLSDPNLSARGPDQWAVFESTGFRNKCLFNNYSCNSFSFCCNWVLSPSFTHFYIFPNCYFIDHPNYFHLLSFIKVCIRFLFNSMA